MGIPIPRDDDVERKMNSYKPSTCAVFHRVTDRFGALSNMADFPIRVNGILIPTTEALYAALRFPHLPDVQKIIIDQKSPMSAKMKSKAHKHLSRPDWEDGVREIVMGWCLRVKLCQHTVKFGNVLKSTSAMPIVEESHKDRFWGAVRQDDGTLLGNNVLGTLLVNLRDEFLTHPSASNVVTPPDIDHALLYGTWISEVRRSKPL